MKFLNHNLFTGDITVNGTTTLSTATGVTRPTGDNTTHLATTAFVKAQDYATNTALGNYVPLSRTLTINGVTYDLSADRSWTIGTADYTSTVKHLVKAGVAITKGQAVYVTSADGTNMIVGLASNATEATSSKTMGLLDATVSTNGFANVVTEGLLAGLNTLGATAGDPVWLGTGGNLIYGLANKPYAPAHLVFIGIVTRVNENNGEIFIKVQNGFELNEIHDVDLKTVVPVNGHILGFDGALWVNKTIAGWLGYTPANASGTTNYISKFTGSTTLGNSQIFDNGTNVGIGTTSPSQKFVVSNGSAEVFKVYDSGEIIAGTNYIYAAASGTSFYSQGAASFRNSIYNDTAAYLQISGGTSGYTYFSGNVGIGTASPSNKLQVASGDMSITSGYSFILADTDTNWRLGRNIIGPVESVYLNSNTFEFVAANASDQGWQFINDDGYPVLEIGAATGSRNVWVNAGNLLVPTGSVGIGTTAPQQKLDVYGNISLGSWTKPGSTYVGLRRNDDGSFGGGGDSGLVIESYNHAAPYTGDYSQRVHLRSHLYNGGSHNVLTAYGINVGIGIDTPSEKLHVVGRARITTIDNGTGDFATISGTGVITRRTAAQVLSDIGAQPSGSYLTAESDTLATVTARGSSTNGSIFINGIFTGGFGAVTTSGTLDWNDVSNARAGQGYTLLLGTATNGMGGGQYYHPVSFEYSSKNGSGNMTQLAIPYTGNGIWYRNRYDGSWSSWARVWDDSSFTSTNITNWNTAYGWGNHASQGYATQTYVNTAIANLVDSAPSTLDTLNELAAALGDDPNFATTVTNSIATKLPLAGGTMTGKIFTVSTGTGTYDTAIEIREQGYVTTSQSAWGYSPAMTFHWGGRHAIRFGLRSDGLMAVDDAPIALRSWVQAQGYLTSESDTLNSVTDRGNTTSNSVRFGSHVDLSPTGSAFRFYDGTTFRGGLGLDDWAHGGSAANITAYVNGDNNFFISTSGVKRAQFNSGAAIFRTYSADNAYNIRITGGDQFNAYYNDSVATLYLQYHNGNGGTLNVGNGKLTVNTAGSVVASGDMRAPIFYDSNDTNYYLDLSSSSNSSYAAGVFRQNDGKYVRDSSYRTYSGYSDYYSGGNAGWYRVAEITLTGNCSGAVIYGTLYDHRYDGADAYQVSIVARAECDFTSNNESHYINVGCTILGSTNYVDYKSKIRVVLSVSSAGSRTYEVQFYETNWNHDTWQLESTGWTVYTTPQAPRTAVGTPRVYYVSNQNADYQRANTATYSPVYYDSDDTTYYADFNSTGGSAIKVRGGILTGPNPSWSQYLQLGGDGNNPSHATVAVTNGNLHIDAKNGYATYINHYYGNKIHLGSGGAAGGTYTHSNFSLAGNLNLGGGDGDASHRLQVIGNALVQGTQGFNATGETASLYIGDTASEIRAVYDGGLDFYQNSVHRVRIEGGTGNFGIGTSDPNYKLEVDSVAQSTVAKFRTSDNNYSTIEVGDTGDVSASVYFASNSGNGQLYKYGSGWGAESGMVAVYSSNGPVALQAGGSTKVFVQSGGNVGIGTDAPSYKFDVSGNSRTTGIHYVNTYLVTPLIYGGGPITMGNEVIISNTEDGKLTLRVPSGDTSDWNYINFTGANGVRDAYLGTDSVGTPTWWRDDNGVNITLGSSVLINGSTAWHAGNDGSGSGLDADLLDGQHGSYYAAASALSSYLPLAGGTMTGTIYFSNDMGTALQGTIGDNDFWRIRGGNAGSNAGFLEIATSDDGTEPIYVRQYTGVFSSLTRTATLLDGSGNTSLPGSLTVGGTITENSSIRYKENIVDLESATEKVEQLRAVRYNKIGHEVEEIGLIAEEVAEVYPEVVNYNEEGQPDGVNYTRLSVILLKAVQELTERINKLESK